MMNYPIPEDLIRIQRAVAYLKEHTEGEARAFVEIISMAIEEVVDYSIPENLQRLYSDAKMLKLNITVGLIERIARLEHEISHEKLERESNILGIHLLKDELAKVTAERDRQYDENVNQIANVGKLQFALDEANEEIVRLNEQIGENK
jgi:hypothetical protein